jgi:hypothetical protein
MSVNLDDIAQVNEKSMSWRKYVFLNMHWYRMRVFDRPCALLYHYLNKYGPLWKTTCSVYRWNEGPIHELMTIEEEKRIYRASWARSWILDNYVFLWWIFKSLGASLDTARMIFQWMDIDFHCINRILRWPEEWPFDWRW